MEIQIKWSYAEGTFDTKNVELLCIPARGFKGEKDAELCFKDPDGGCNYTIADIHTGVAESANALCEEIVRRFNEFPEELKR